MKNRKPACIVYLRDHLAEMAGCVEGKKSVEDVGYIINRYTGERPCGGTLEDNIELVRKTIKGITTQINQWR